MNKEIVKQNILQVIYQPCFASPQKGNCKNISADGLCENGKCFYVSLRPDDTLFMCWIKDSDGNDIDFVQNIIDQLPPQYREHLVTLRHDNYSSYSYDPVFDSDTQAVWNEALDKFMSGKQERRDKSDYD